MEENVIDIRWFAFPVRVYQVSFRDIAIKIKDELERTIEEGAVPPGESIDDEEFGWALGYIRIPFHDAMNLQWADCQMEKLDPKDIFEKGFDSTKLILPTGEQHLCTWRRKRFEDELGKFIKKYEEKFGGLENNS